MAPNEPSFAARKAVPMGTYALPSKATWSAMTPSYVAPHLSPPSLPPCQLATRQLPPLLPPPHPRAFIPTDHHPYSWSEPPSSSMANRPLFRASVAIRGSRAGSVPSVPPSATGCAASAGVPWSRSGGRTDSGHRQSVESSHQHEPLFALRSPLLAMSKHLQRSHQCQALERNAVEQRNSCQEHLHGVVSEDKPSPKAIPCQGTSEGKSSEQTNPGASEGKLVVEEVEILEFSNDDIAGPINQKPLTVPQDAPLDLMQEELLPPAALSMGGLDFPYDWSTFSSQDPEPESLETPRGELPTIASLESLQEEGVGSPVSVLRRHGSSPGSATSLSDKPLETVHSSNSLHSGDNLDLHLGGLAGRVLLYPEFGQEEGADFSGVMEDDEMWASLSSPEASEGWLAAACLATCWPKAPRSKRRRVSMEASGTDASAPSASVGAAASDEGKGPGDLIEGFTVADSANLDGLQAAASESMASEPTVFASASASLFSGYIPHALSCNSLSAVAAPQSASASAAAATSWVQPRTAFLQALLEDVRRPKRVRGSAASASTWRYVAVEDHHDGASSDGYAGQTRGPLRTPKFKRDAATAFGPTALGVLHLLPGSSSSASLYTSESAEAWNSPSGSGSPGWSDTVAASAAGAGPAGAGSGWFRTNSTSSLESFSGTSNASAIPSLALPLPAFVSNVSGGVRRCVHCKSTKTPQWRMGPAGPKTLCNACGVRFKKGKLCPEYRPANSPEYEESKHSNQHRKILAMRSSSMAAAAS